MSKHTQGPLWYSKNSNEVGTVPTMDIKVCGWISGANREEKLANGELFAAASDLLACLTDGAQVNTPDFLDWVADRFVHVYGENPNVDSVLSLRKRAAAMRAVLKRLEVLDCSDCAHSYDLGPVIDASGKRVADFRCSENGGSTTETARRGKCDYGNGGQRKALIAETVTGRLASSAPALQNIPIRTEEGRKIRRALVAKEETS